MEAARALLHDHELALGRCDPAVDLDGLGADLQELDGDLVHPEPHVRVRAVDVLVRGRRVDDRDALRAAGLVERLHGRDDRLHPVARERVAGTRPGVREVDVDERRPRPEADPSLEAALAVDARVGVEDRLERRAHRLVVAHLTPPGAVGCSARQWRAMSARVATQTSSRAATCSRKRRSPASARDARRSGSGARRTASGHPPSRSSSSESIRYVAKSSAVTNPFGRRNLKSLASSVYGTTRCCRPDDVDPVRELVGVRVRVVEEAALLDDEPSRRVGCRAPCTTRRGAAPHTPSIAAIERREVRPLLLRGELAVVDPAPPVARDLPPGVDHRPRRGGVLLERLAHREDGERHPERGHEAVDAPEPHPAPELEHRLRVEVAPADRGRRADHLVEVRLRGGIALERRVLAALLVVEDEAERDALAAGPARVRRARAVADAGRAPSRSCRRSPGRRRHRRPRARAPARACSRRARRAPPPCARRGTARAPRAARASSRPPRAGAGSGSSARGRASGGRARRSHRAPRPGGRRAPPRRS